MQCCVEHAELACQTCRERWPLLSSRDCDADSEGCPSKPRPVQTGRDRTTEQSAAPRPMIPFETVMLEVRLGAASLFAMHSRNWQAVVLSLRCTDQLRGSQSSIDARSSVVKASSSDLCWTVRHSWSYPGVCSPTSLSDSGVCSPAWQYNVPVSTQIIVGVPAGLTWFRGRSCRAENSRLHWI
jgi:hypothetical protein